MPELVTDTFESESLPMATVLGLPIHLATHYADWLVQQVRQGSGGHVVTLNAEMAMQGEQDESLAAIIRQAELVIPDGVGVVFYLWLRRKRIQRCPGIELAEALVQRSPDVTTPAGKQADIFLFGGAPGVSELAARRLQERWPDVAIAGTEHGFLNEAEQAELHQRLQHLQPAIILVGMGVPRQERWIAEHRHLCPHATWIGVGGSFDIWSGTKTRAPGWLRNNGLEWLYRLYQEPWRWRRMLVLPRFAWKALIHPKT